MKKRPLGVTILSILYLTIAIITFIAFTIITISGRTSLLQFNNGLGFLVVINLFYRLISAITGVLMWSGRKYGWYLGLFYQIYGFIFSIVSLVTHYNELVKYQSGNIQIFISDLFGISISIVICQYLFKNHVLKFFDMDSLERNKMVIEITKVLIVAVVFVFMNRYIGVKM